MANRPDGRQDTPLRLVTLTPPDTAGEPVVTLALRSQLRNVRVKSEVPILTGGTSPTRPPKPQKPHITHPSEHASRVPAKSHEPHLISAFPRGHAPRAPHETSLATKHSPVAGSPQSPASRAPCSSSAGSRVRAAGNLPLPRVTEVTLRVPSGHRSRKGAVSAGTVGLEPQVGRGIFCGIRGLVTHRMGSLVPCGPLPPALSLCPGFPPGP